MNKPIWTTVFGEVLEVPILHNEHHLCNGCVADRSSRCHTMPHCTGTIFIKNTPEAIAEYVKLRMMK